jgi:hypothetical protein
MSKYLGFLDRNFMSYSLKLRILYDSTFSLVMEAWILHVGYELIFCWGVGCFGEIIGFYSKMLIVPSLYIIFEFR